MPGEIFDPRDWEGRECDWLLVGMPPNILQGTGQYPSHSPDQIRSDQLLSRVRLFATP